MEYSTIAKFVRNIKIDGNSLKVIDDNVQSLDMPEICRSIGLSEDCYRVVFMLDYNSETTIGITDYVCESKTTMSFYAAWHDGEFKNFPGELGGWWSNEIVCGLSPEDMIINDIMIPENFYKMTITFEKDER
jgi:hypothetical protein